MFRFIENWKLRRKERKFIEMYDEYMEPLIKEFCNLLDCSYDRDIEDDVYLCRSSYHGSRKHYSYHTVRIPVLQFMSYPGEIKNAIRDAIEMTLSSYRSMPSATSYQMQAYSCGGNKDSLSQQELNEIVQFVLMISRGQIKLQPKEGKAA